MKNLTDRILYGVLFAKTLLEQQGEAKNPKEKPKEKQDGKDEDVLIPIKDEKEAKDREGASIQPHIRAISSQAPAMNFDRFFELVEAEADLLPEAFFDELNLGIIAEDREKRNPAGEDLFILGEYRRSQIGNQICLFYGSFVRLLGIYASEERYRDQVRKTLRHEFRHHMEGRAGIRDLEIEDARFLEAYRRNKKTRPGGE